MTVLPSGLVDAYRATHFKVIEPLTFTLRVGHRSSELADLYKNTSVSSAGYLTAWNPYSAEACTSDNAVAQLSLIRRLSLDGYPTLKALGVDAASEWPGEESVLVPGLDLQHAKSLGVEFGQNAIVWAGSDAIPELFLLR